MTWHEIHGSSWWLSFVSLPSSYKLSFFKLFKIENIILQRNCFFPKSSHFCAIAFQNFWSGTLLPIGEKSGLIIKGSTWCIHDFRKAVSNNIRASSPFNVAVITCFWYFNNDIFSLIIPFAFDNDNVSLIQVSRLHTWVLFATFFSASKSKVDFYSKILIENQLPVESNQIRRSITICSIKCLPSKIGG